MGNAEQTRQRILAAAEAEFSELGLYGARVDAIAQRADANKRMIYAYFGNKEQLYATVLTAVYSRMADAERELLTDQLPASERIRRIVAVYFHFLQQHPTFVRLLMWENLNYAGVIRASQAHVSKGWALKALEETITGGMADGSFRPDIDPENAVLAINMMCFSYFSNIHTMSYLLEKDLSSEAAVAGYTADVTEMILRYLTNT